MTLYEEIHKAREYAERYGEIPPAFALCIPPILELVDAVRRHLIDGVIAHEDDANRMLFIRPEASVDTLREAFAPFEREVWVPEVLERS